MNVKINKVDYKSFIRELLIIIIGVCIGMMLNTWNQKRIDKNQANQYLNGVIEELRDNSKNVEWKRGLDIISINLFNIILYV